MLRIFKNFTKKDYGRILVCLVFIVIQVWLDLKLPDYMAGITTLIETGTGAVSSVAAAGAKMLCCAAGSLISSVFVAAAAAKIAAEFSANLRGKVFDKVQSFSMKEIGNFSEDSLITRCTNDITQIQMFVVMGLQAVIKAPITAVWAVMKIAGKGTEWTKATACAVVFLVLFVGICTYFALPKFQKLQTLTDNLNRVTRENLTGLRVVRAYNAEKYQEKKFDTANEELTYANLYANRIMASLMPVIQAMMNFLTLIIYWIGAGLIQSAPLAEDKMTLFSNMVVFSSYAVQVVMAFMMLVMVLVMLPRVAVSSKRVLEVLDTGLSVKDGSKTDGLTQKKGEVEFRNVSFGYPDAEKNVIENISFTAHKGETVAFIGATGCGKSTVVNLIPRFYDATEGEVLVDGIDVKEYKQIALRKKIGYVSQKAYLFSGTVRSNVIFGDNADDECSMESHFQPLSVKAHRIKDRVKIDRYSSNGDIGIYAYIAPCDFRIRDNILITKPITERRIFDNADLMQINKL